MVVAIVAGLAALGYFGILPLFVAGGQQDIDAVDWSSCSVERVHEDPYNQTRKIIECDHVLLSYAFSSTTDGRKATSGTVLRERRSAIREWFDFQDFSSPHWKLDIRKTNTSVFGYPSDHFVLRSIAMDDGRGTSKESIGGYAIAVSAQNRDQMMYLLCASKTISWRVCEGVIRDLLEGQHSDLTGNTMPPIGLIDPSDVRDEEGVGDELASSDDFELAPAAPGNAAPAGASAKNQGKTIDVVELSNTEIAKMKKLGEDTYIDHCAKCHNFGTSSSAPKVGEGVFAKRDREILSLEDSKCTDKEGKLVLHSTTNREFSAAQWKLK